VSARSEWEPSTRENGRLAWDRIEADEAEIDIPAAPAQGSLEWWVTLSKTQLLPRDEYGFPERLCAASRILDEITRIGKRSLG
jgi:hypothetical protein